MLDWHWQAANQAFRTRGGEEIYEWARQNISVGSWSPWPGTKFDATLTPQIIEPLRALRRKQVHQVTIVAATGGSKSTVGELFIAWSIVEDPGFTVWYEPTEASAKEFSESRIMPFLEHCPKVVELFPPKWTAKRTTQILFPHMTFLVQPANLTSAQSKHIRYLLMDEAWEYEPGMMAQLLKRTNKFSHNRKVLIFGTGSNLGDEQDQAFKSGSRREWQLRCPQCRALHAPQFSFGDSFRSRGGVKWSPAAKGVDGTWSERKVRETAHYECPSCASGWPVNDETHVWVNEHGEFTAGSPESAPGAESYHWNAIASDYRQLPQIAWEYLAARRALKAGDMSLWEEFVRKRLALPWAEEIPQLKIQSIGAGYKMGDAWNEEQVRFATIDVQQTHYWIVIRGWCQGPKSRLIYCGRIESWPDVYQCLQRFGILHQFTFVDSSHFTDDVYQQCCLHDWNALKGEKAEGGYTEFKPGLPDVKDKPGFKVPARPAGTGVRGVPSVLLPGSMVPTCELILVSDSMTSDSLRLCREGYVSGWSIASDTPQFYRDQLASMIRRQREHPRTGEKIWEWAELGKAGNHLWDCERYQLAAAFITGLMLPIEGQHEA